MLLVNTNRCRNPYPVFPLGLGHVASALKKKGFTVCMVDMVFEEHSLESIISSFCPDFVGLSLRNIDDVRIDNTQFFIPDLNAVLQRVRAVTSVPTILGGSAFSLFPDRILLYSGADYGIVSEAEHAFPALLNELSLTNVPTKAQLEVIPGLVYRDGAAVMINAVNVLNPAEITIPERPHHILDCYLKTSGVINIQTQRGCPFQCCYCTYPLIEGRTIRFRSAQSVGEELMAASRQGARYVFIVDSVFNTSADHVASICNELLRLNLNLEWGCFLRPSHITPDLMRLMARAGLKHIEFGSDSLCDSVLESYLKNFTFEDILYVSELARNEKVHYAHFLITGGPGETEKTMLEGYENSLRLKKTVVFPFTGMRLYPGTPLYATALEQKVISGDEDLLDPLFYLSPELTKEKIAEIHRTFHQKSPNWIIDELPPEMVAVMERLRSKGVTGPMWEFLVR